MTVGPLLLAAAGLAHPGGLSATTAHDWVHLHIVLLPLFPLLALGFVVLLRGRPRADVAGVATVVAWAGAAVYAVGYTGLDAVAGIGAGTVAGQPGDPSELRRLVLALYEVADEIGRAGVYALLVAVLAGTVALLTWHGPGVLAGTVVLLGAGYSFLDSHIFWPRGVLTMLAIAIGFALWAWAAGRRPRPAAPAPDTVTT
ncbi:hypothetical protein AB0M54_18215 [Actinoplanes sp. NPDC051470]|uniref:hypothetical protein n=1 Tax=unclassified Actinoplanes TaxID=2626549 RepID=UPI0034472DF1